MTTTVFLSVLILALALGNGFLSLVDPKRLRLLSAKGRILGEMPAIPENGFGLQNGFGSPNGLGPQKSLGIENGAVQGKLPVSFGSSRGLSFEERANRERMLYLNKRIERLEQLLLKINDSKFVAQKINGSNLFKKLKELEGFKQDTKLEIAALNQRLDKVQPRKKLKKPGPGISDEKLRDLVFRASN